MRAERRHRERRRNLLSGTAIAVADGGHALDEVTGTIRQVIRL